MIIKKFQGNTETEAIMKARDELGKDAIVTNVKQIKPGGLMRLFKKPTYEITAALDETPPKTSCLSDEFFSVPPLPFSKIGRGVQNTLSAPTYSSVAGVVAPPSANAQSTHLFVSTSPV